MQRLETDDNQCAATPRFARGPIFASVVIAIPVFISVGLLATSNNGLKPHREVIDIHKYPWSSVGKINATGYSSGHLCTGAVIGPNLFLTAAHCLYNIPSARFMSANSIHILIGYEKGEYRAHRVASGTQSLQLWIHRRLLIGEIPKRSGSQLATIGPLFTLTNRSPRM